MNSLETHQILVIGRQHHTVAVVSNTYTSLLYALYWRIFCCLQMVFFLTLQIVSHREIFQSTFCGGLGRKTCNTNLYVTFSLSPVRYSGHINNFRYSGHINNQYSGHHKELVFRACEPAHHLKHYSDKYKWSVGRNSAVKNCNNIYYLYQARPSRRRQYKLLVCSQTRFCCHLY